MKTKRTLALAVTFLLGTVVGAAAAKKMGVDPALYTGKDKKAAGQALLQTAREIAAKEGSWEKIAVGRAYYLGGLKAEGQAIFDEVTGNKKVEGGDWIRVGRVYYEAGEWEKARTAFEKALAMEPNDAPLDGRDRRLLQREGGARPRRGAVRQVVRDRAWRDLEHHQGGGIVPGRGAELGPPPRPA